MSNIIRPIFWKPKNDECYYQLEIYEGLKLGFLELVEFHNEDESLSFRWTKSGLAWLGKDSTGSKDLILRVEQNKGVWQGLLSMCYCPCDACQEAVEQENLLLEETTDDYFKSSSGLISKAAAILSKIGTEKAT